ncbi:MAG TPA: anaerobic ribonucleoside-triphosphate reductase activating protein [Firmicutes bacterium]|nr:anaerobic ribonucleoside-triphosphate reductase activating protein [Bacillota bacterium]
MVIRGIQKTSLVDFPGNICVTVFTGGCNMRCPYCHNRDLVLEAGSLPRIPQEEILALLESRAGLVDGVCITGGEPTLQEELGGFAREVKSLGFKVKLDTNGTNPRILDELLGRGLLDYVAMDIKAPLGKYRELTRSQVNLRHIDASIGLIRSSRVDYEFRTTVAPGLITGEDLLEIGRWLAGARKYVLQQYMPGPTLDEAFAGRRPYSGDWLEDAARKLRPFFERVEVRK